MSASAPPFIAVALSAAGTFGLGAAARVAQRASEARRVTNRLQPGAGLVAPAWFGRMAAGVAPEADLERAWTVAVVAGAGSVVAGAAMAPLVTLVVSVVVGSVGRVVWGWRRDRPPTVEAYRTDLLASLAEVHASLSSGASLVQALEGGGRRFGPAAADLADVASSAHQLGVQPGLDRWAERRPGTGADLVADALAIAGTTGASQTAAVGAVADTLRRRQAQAREVRALASQARASGVVLVVLPLAFAVAISAADRRVASFLLGTAAGWACLLVGLGLDAAGAWWMSALVRRVR